MTEDGWKTITAADVRVGDRVSVYGVELTVTRIDEGFLGNPDSFGFVEDTDERWFKMAAFRDTEVSVFDA